MTKAKENPIGIRETLDNYNPLVRLARWISSGPAEQVYQVGRAATLAGGLALGALLAHQVIQKSAAIEEWNAYWKKTPEERINVQRAFFEANPELRAEQHAFEALPADRQAYERPPCDKKCQEINRSLVGENFFLAAMAGGAYGLTLSGLAWAVGSRRREEQTEPSPSLEA